MDRYEIAAALLRGSHVAALLSLAGCVVFRTFVVSRNAEGVPLATLNRIARTSTVAALVFGGAWLVIVSGTIADANDFGSLLQAIPLVARHTNFGNLVCVRLLLLIAVLALHTSRGALARIAALLLTAAAVGLQPLLGHIGAEDGWQVMVPVEIAHLLAAGAWFGSLLPLLVCVMRAPTPVAARLCDRFTPAGLVAVGIIAATALPQAGALIGGLPGLFGTPYGHMALVKIGLFVLALGLACVNRLVLTPRLAAGHGRRAMVGTIAIEAAAVCCIIFAASTMASLTPGAHMQPVWPFPWRPGLEAWQDPDGRWELLRLLIAAGVGMMAIALSVALRRFRWLAVALAVIVVAPFTPALGLLFVEAYPASYASSTTGFSVDSIVHGQRLFAQRCAVCHESQEGSGGAADLTAPHIWGHLDGELFWWVTNGVQDSHGSALMPAFGSVLSVDDRWALIDFIHAWNIGRQTADTGHWQPPIAAPSTPLACANTDADSLADLTGHVLVIDIDGDPAAPAAEPGAAGPITIKLSRYADAKPATGACVAASRDAWEAWLILAGAAADRFAGTRAIVDGRGWLRAWLPPDAGSDQLQTVIHDARDHPIVASARPAHHH